MRLFFLKKINWADVRSTLIFRMGFFGFSSGLTSAFFFNVLNTWLSSADINAKELGFFAIATWAYGLKCLLSPFVDRITFWGLTRHFGQRKGWMIVSQIFLSLSLVGMGFLTPQKDLTLIFILSSFFGLWASFQDLVLEAYRTENTPQKDQSAVAGANAFGYRLGFWSMGYLPLILSHYLGWKVSFLVLSIFSILQISVVLGCPKEDIKCGKNLQYFPRLKETIKDLYQKFFLGWALGLIAAYKLGDLFLRGMTTRFLLQHQGYSLKDLANMDKGIGTLAVFLGVGLGAWIVQKKGLRWAMALWAILQGAVGLLFAIQALTAKNTLFGMTCLLGNHFASGLGGAAITVYLSFMAVKSPHVAIAYAFLSSFGSLVRIGVSIVSGITAEYCSWPVFFMLSGLACLPAFILSFCSQSFARRVDNALS